MLTDDWHARHRRLLFRVNKLNKWLFFRGYRNVISDYVYGVLICSDTAINWTEVQKPSSAAIAVHQRKRHRDISHSFNLVAAHVYESRSIQWQNVVPLKENCFVKWYTQPYKISVDVKFSMLHSGILHKLATLLRLICFRA